MGNTKEPMVSRSLRLHKNTLSILEREAKRQDLGITVYIRHILEAVVDNLSHDASSVHVPVYGEDALEYPEL